MSAPRPVDLFISLDLHERALTVENRTAGGAPEEHAIGDALPLRLRLEPDHEDANNVVRVVVEGAAKGAPTPPFEPHRAQGSEVLATRAELSDVALGTQDDTRWIVTVANRSAHFAAEDIRVVPRLDPRCGQAVHLVLPDGNPIFEFSPPSQEIRCLAPGDERKLTFVVITRGPAPGTYAVLVELAYTLVYWERREMRGRSLHAIAVTDRCPPKKPPCGC